MSSNNKPHFTINDENFGVFGIFILGGVNYQSPAAFTVYPFLPSAIWDSLLQISFLGTALDTANKFLTKLL
jgi:hypothetical protein